MNEYLLVRNINNKLEFENGRGFQRRNESTMNLIRQTHEILGLKDFDWTYIFTGDRDEYGKYHQGKRVLSYSSSSSFHHVIPDFIFDCWREVHIDDYENIVEQIIEHGNKPPETNVLGWRGAMTHENRRNILNFTDPNKFDIQEHTWNNSTNYMSFPECIKKWRYLIDVEGGGYSGRIKLFLFSNRALFLQDRPYKEWFHSELIPWVHYIPVNRNLDNLDEQLDIIRNDPELENSIRHNAREFAIHNLRRKNALERMKFVLEPSMCPRVD